MAKKKPVFRINLFEQLTSFYEFIWYSEFNFRSHHVSLYIFLLNQNNRSNWSLWFDLPFDLGKKGACIGSKKTYYQTIKELEQEGLIKYEKGANEWRAPRVQLLKLQRGKNGPLPIPLVNHNLYHNHTTSDPSSEPQPIPQGGRDIDNRQETEDKRQKNYFFVFLESLNACEEVKSDAIEYFKSLKSKAPKWSEKTYTRKIQEYSNYSKGQIESAVYKTIDNGWKGLFPENEKPKDQKPESSGDSFFDQFMNGDF